MVKSALEKTVDKLVGDVEQVTNLNGEFLVLKQQIEVNSEKMGQQMTDFFERIERKLASNDRQAITAGKKVLEETEGAGEREATWTVRRF